MGGGGGGGWGDGGGGRGCSTLNYSACQWLRLPRNELSSSSSSCSSGLGALRPRNGLLGGGSYWLLGGGTLPQGGPSFSIYEKLAQV